MIKQKQKKEISGYPHFIYDRTYYLSDCDGYIQFNNSKGKILGKRLKKIFALAHIERGMKVLDIGCGRGELVLNSALFKAHAWGVDSSTHAIDICKNTLDFWENDYPWIKKYGQFLNLDAGYLDFDDDFFDVIILSDIVEHLDKHHLKIILKQIKRVLKNTGRVIIHTSPNRYYLPFSGVLFFLISNILVTFKLPSQSPCKTMPLNLRKCLPRGLAKDVHINEQSSFGLRRILRKTGLKVEKIWFELNPHYIDMLFPDKRGFKIINTLKTIIPLKHLFYADLYCIASIL
ncbi:MAG: class I SAM-dependent methyltransferase [Candidatus Aminicenantes bacterium]|nr:class I SAM-dependent methyltransferase [Candidatus Aminicenantes bacterium]